MNIASFLNEVWYITLIYFSAKIQIYKILKGLLNNWIKIENLNDRDVDKLSMESFGLNQIVKSFE